MNALESQMKAIDDAFDLILRPAARVHHACEDFDHALELGFGLRFVFDWSQPYRDVWPDVTITHAYIVTPNTRTEIPVPLADLDIDKWTEECAGRVDERQ